MRDQRDAARNHSLGEALRAQYEDQFIRRGAVQGGRQVEDTVYKPIQKRLMQNRVPEGAVNEALYHFLLGTKVNDCRGHVGQAFKHSNWSDVSLWDSCYVCKISLGYDEVKEPDYEESTVRLNHRDLAYPCAEVPASV
jgi:hypothetical protein